MENHIEKTQGLVNFVQTIINTQHNSIAEFAKSSQKDVDTVVNYISKNPQTAYYALHNLLVELGSKLEAAKEEPSSRAPYYPPENYVLCETYEELKEHYRQLESEYQLQKDEYEKSKRGRKSSFGKDKQLEQRVNDLQNENDRLSDKVRELSEELNRQGQENSKINNRLNQAISELSEYRRVDSDTYSSTGLRPDELSRKYHQFKQQDCHEISVVVNQYNQQSGGNSKKQILEIKAFLSKNVIMRAYDFFQQEALIFELTNLLNEIKNTMLPESLQEELNKTINTYLDTQIDTEFSEPDDRRKQEIIESVQIIKKHWDLSDESTKEVEQFCNHTYTLVGEMCPFNKPIDLWLPEPQIPFNLEEHQEIVGYSDSGYVLDAIFPGYTIGDLIIDRAEVTTTPSVVE